MIDLKEPATESENYEANREEGKAAIAILIRNFLDREGRRVGWLAGQIGVHRTTVSRILHRKVLPDPATCRSLAAVMDLPPEQVLSAAGYLPPMDPLNSTFNLGDPELGFYLSQIGKMPEKTQQIVKTILREEYTLLQKLKTAGAELDSTERPPFARHSSSNE